MFLHRVFLGEREISETEDVRRNILYILRTKRGVGYFLDDFGLTETGYHTAEEMFSIISAEIQETLERYEPRIVIQKIDEAHGPSRRPILRVRYSMKSTGEVLVVITDRTGTRVELDGE